MKNTTPDPIELALIGLLALALALRPLLVALVALVLTLAGWRPQRATPAPSVPARAPEPVLAPVEVAPAPARKRAPRKPRTMKPVLVTA